MMVQLLRSAAFVAIIVGSASTVLASTSEASFLGDSHAAMNKMMTSMTTRPSGNIDKDFVAMMVPHHQGAIDMAESELRFGNNQRLHRLAQEIIVTQQQEIAAMRLAVGEPLPPSVASPANPALPVPSTSHHTDSHEGAPL